jgi:hypothetical protein
MNSRRNGVRFTTKKNKTVYWFLLWTGCSCCCW